MGRLFPRESVLLELLAKINDPDIVPLWAEDETIGWIYQYFNSVEERRQMRSESQAPRNSRELAVRNQFFTPRYVVEFLTDNTLGRIWYEMTQSNTSLKDSCSYLVRRPSEIFLAKGEEAPEQEEPSEDLSQEELLKQPVYIPFRPLKDPREILMLDPACGSMHFGLYAFDLFERIYGEAWDLEEQLGADVFQRSDDSRPLRETYTEKEDLLCDIPRLIIEHNIHGIDIDPRAVQIAGLSLWLRAQRSWKEQGLKPGDRPQIRKSNIVCAEPMPGEKDMLREFAKSLKPRVLGQLVESIFEEMELAGEAGSLLKIEEQIEEAVEKAREEFNRELLQRKEEAGYLPGMAPERQPALFDFADLPDRTRFWSTAEQNIFDALRHYAEHVEDGTASRRRLFAEDAAKGFAFIDLCRKRFDVILMNPPFGEASPAIIQRIEYHYPSWNRNLLCAFIHYSLQSLLPKGFIGSVFDKTAAIKTTYERFRREVLLQNGGFQTQVSLGWGVLDDANVEAAALISSAGFQESPEVFFDVGRHHLDRKEGMLLRAIQGLPIEHFEDCLYYCQPAHLTSLPNAAIAFDFPLWLQLLFTREKSLHDLGCSAFVGHSFKSERHFRLLWELPLEEPVSFSLTRWTWLFNGGEYCPFYKVERDVVAYGKDGNAVANDQSVTFRSIPLHGRAGIGYGKRGEFIDAQVLGPGHAFTVEGEGASIPCENDRFYFAALFSSHIFSYGINMYCGQHKYPGYVNIFPAPHPEADQKWGIVQAAKRIWTLKRQWQTGDETDVVFLRPHILNYVRSSFGQRVDALTKQEAEHDQEIASATMEIDQRFETIYRLTSDNISEVYGFAERRPPDRVWMNGPIEVSAKAVVAASDILSYAIGCVYGRWDIRLANDESLEIPEADLSNSPPRYAYGALLDEKRALYKEEPNGYPLDLAWDGILVDDESHRWDIARNAQHALEVIFAREEAVESEICSILNASSIRQFLCNISRFFGDHLNRYSKSRRQAPIYWPLSTASGSYTLWIYYHRLTDQTLYTCVNDFVEPKLKQISEAADELRRKTGRSRQEERELEKLADLELELQDFRDELLRIARFWKPNLNDGVQITAAPLWKLFKLPKWQKTLRTTWEKLEKGHYDWAHLAYSIWPERIIRKSHQDRSLAIAHDLEEDLWDDFEDGTDRRGNPKIKWVPKDFSKEELDQLIEEKAGGRG